MDKQIIKVGISCENTDDIVSEQLLQILNEKRIFELCIPIVYNQPKLFKTKRLPIPTVNIPHANESLKGDSDIIKISSKITPVTVKQKINESSIAIEKSIHKGLSDLKTGRIDVFVMLSTSTNLLQQIVSKLSDRRESLPILVNEYFRITEVSDFISVNTLLERIKILHSALFHDFMLTIPRIAILSVNLQSKIIIDAIQIAFKKRIFCFGIFDPDFFFNSGTYKKFDAALIINCTSTNFIFQFFQPVSDETNVFFIGNLPYVVTVVNARSAFSGIYLAIDIYRHRKSSLIDM